MGFILVDTLQILFLATNANIVTYGNLFGVVQPYHYSLHQIKSH